MNRVDINPAQRHLPQGERSGGSMLPTRIIQCALAALLLAALPVSSLHAHGSKQHPNDKAAATAAPEQTPFGMAGNPRRFDRTIHIEMSDAMRFTPDLIDVRQGEAVRFVVSNRGALLHEMVIGTEEDLKKHAALMQKFPDMEHDEPNMAHVSPGKSEPLVWTFNRPGTFHFACLVAGHFEAGMKGRIRVVGRSER